ncbi:MAG: hypothetical protein IJQ80_02340 [Clostridia bacterium]|nr:hypothetical protein [Clostridia bacterium]
MRKETATRHITIREDRPEAFDERINAVLSIPNLTSHRLTYLTGGLCAAIEYTTEITIFENIKEEYEARGEVYYCDECPFLEPVTDHRRRTRDCICGHPTTKGVACLYFYEKLAKGELEPKGGRL